MSSVGYIKNQAFSIKTLKAFYFKIALPECDL